MNRREALRRLTFGTAAVVGAQQAIRAACATWGRNTSSVHRPESKRERVVDVTAPSFDAKGDGLTDDTKAFQAAIDSFLTDRGPRDFSATGAGPFARGTVRVPAGVYRVANVLLRSGVRIVGEGAGVTIVKLTDGVAPAGSPAPHAPANVFCTTLDHTGTFNDPVFGPQRWHEGTASDSADTLDRTRRAGMDGTQRQFIVDDVVIARLTIDGNRAANGLGDLGGNASAMGAGVALHQARNVSVDDCTIHDCRLDGIHLGYTLHGGSYNCGARRCVFEDNTRTGMAFVTGYGNYCIHSRFSGSGGQDIDVEANWHGEVNKAHRIEGNIGHGDVAIVSRSISDQGRCVVSESRFRRLVIHPVTCPGARVAGCTFTGDGSGPAIEGAGSGGAFAPVTISGCTFSRFASILDGWADGRQGSVANLHVIGNRFIDVGASGAVLVNLHRPYGVRFADNTLEVRQAGAERCSIFRLAYNWATSEPLQGANAIVRNTVHGAAQPLEVFCRIEDGAHSPGPERRDIIEGNVVRAVVRTGITMTADTNHGLVVRGNDFAQAVAARQAATGTFLNTADLPGTTRLVIERNTLAGFDVGIALSHPRGCRIDGNVLRDVRTGIRMTYDARGAGGAGGNSIRGNRLSPAAGATTAISVRATGALAGDRMATDVIQENVVAPGFRAWFVGAPGYVPRLIGNSHP